jgi:hypothetical protein
MQQDRYTAAQALRNQHVTSNADSKISNADHQLSGFHALSR